MDGLLSLLSRLLLFSYLYNCSYGTRGSFFFLREPENLIAATGQNSTLNCKAYATGKEITYFWKFNGSFINKDGNNGFKFSNGSGSLHIFNVNRTKHDGAYECIAFTKDLGAIKSKKSKLQVTYFIKESVPDARIGVPTSMPFYLKGPKYSAFPAPTFNWSYADKLVEEGDINVSDDKNLFMTSQGDILVPYVAFTYGTAYQVHVNHPTLDKPDFVQTYLDMGVIYPGPCKDSSMTSFPTIREKTVAEGSNVSFECFAVARRCMSSISIRWIKKKACHVEYLNETSRRLVLNNVTKKSHQGTYECEGQVVRTGTKIKIPYELIVLETPKLIKKASPNINLSADGILRPAVFSKGMSLSWYKDGDIINYKSALFEVSSNGNLRIKNPSPVFNGIYQMFFQHLGGIAVFSQAVTVNDKVGCGWKIVESSGIVTYTHDTTSRQDICTWLFQLPSAQPFKFQILKFNFANGAMLSFYDGATASGPKLARLFSNMKTHAITSVRGPFITMVLEAEAASTGSFSLSYGTKSQVPTRPSAVTTKPSAVTTKPSAVKTKPSAVTKKPSAVTTKYSVRTSKKIKATKTPAKGKRKGCDRGSNARIAVAVIVTIIVTLVVVALILLIIFRFFREKVLRICVRNGSTKTPGTPDASATPMVEVSSSKEA